MILETVLGGLAQGIGGMTGGIASTLGSMRNTDKTNQANKDVAAQNLGFQKEQQDYQKALQQQIFEREDTAHQREIEDLKRAGINPLATAGGNGANAGSVVPLTELNNTYQAQTADFSGLQTAGQALDAAVQNQMALEDARQAREDQKTENMYARTQQHAQFAQEITIREQEANLNMLKTLADIADQTQDKELRKKTEEAQEQIAWANLAQTKKAWEANQSYAAEQERALKIANERAEHDYNIDKRAGTKSTETQDNRVTSAQRIASAIFGGGNKNDNEQILKQMMELDQTDALSLKILSQQLTKKIPDATSENPKSKTITQIKKYWETTANDLKRNGRSKKLIDIIRTMQRYGAVPDFK